MRFVAPKAMRLVGAPDNRRVDAADFREELAGAQHPNGGRYAIEVSDVRTYLKPRPFVRIGEIHFTEAVASYSGDHRLHFHHPEFHHAS